MTFLSAPVADTRNRLALLVDGDNMSPTLAPQIMAEARRHGDPAIRRVYGKGEGIAAWDSEGFRLVPTRPGKNAADLLLSVEAVILALRDGIGTLVIASSDGDFTYLAAHLRELGQTVIGIGEAKAPAAFRAACTRFAVVAPAPEPAGSRRPATQIIPVIRDILRHTSHDGGWAGMGWVERHLQQRDRQFDPKLYGHATTEALIRATRYFEVEEGESGPRLRDPNPKGLPAARSLAEGSAEDLSQKDLRPTPRSAP